MEGITQALEQTFESERLWRLTKGRGQLASVCASPTSFPAGARNSERTWPKTIIVGSKSDFASVSERIAKSGGYQFSCFSRRFAIMKFYLFFWPESAGRQKHECHFVVRTGAQTATVLVATGLNLLVILRRTPNALAVQSELNSKSDFRQASCPVA